MLNLVSAETRLETAFRDDVLRGLSRSRKSVPCRWLYDERGSDLFEQITSLEDYYPTRIETTILRKYASEIATFAAHTDVLVEFGAGSGKKTEILLASILPPLYVPIDICGHFLKQTVERMRRLFPEIVSYPVVADFVAEFSLPAAVVQRAYRTAFFPGSTIGNLAPPKASALLRRMRAQTGHNGRAIIGVDLRKEVKRLMRAYDDSHGITAAFNLNLLERMNRELAADFDVEQFGHEARWNDAESAVEMHLVSRIDQDVAIANRLFTFKAGESIHTESSRKYDVSGFTALGQRNGWRLTCLWQDPARDFAVFGLSAT